MAKSMANKSTTSTKKTYIPTKGTVNTASKVECEREEATEANTVVEDNEIEVSKVNEIKKEVKSERKFAAGDMIPCRCVRPNMVVFYSTKTDTRYEFGGYGDINEVDYSDLMRLRSSKSPVLYQPKILIEDEDLRKAWARDLESVANEYEGIYETEQLFYKDPEDFEKYLRNASNGIKDLVRLSASNLIKEEKLTDIRIIRVVDDVLGTQYKDFM